MQIRPTQIDRQWQRGSGRGGERDHQADRLVGGRVWDRMTGATGYAILGHWPVRRLGQQFPSIIIKTIQTLKIKNTSFPRSKNIQSFQGTGFEHGEQLSQLG
jgi:hypothetical protein